MDLLLGLKMLAEILVLIALVIELQWHCFEVHDVYLPTVPGSSLEQRGHSCLRMRTKVYTGLEQYSTHRFDSIF